MICEPDDEIQRVCPKSNKETQCCLAQVGDSPLEEQFIETVKLNSKLAEDLGAAKKEIEILKGRLKEFEMNQLARDCMFRYHTGRDSATKTATNTSWEEQSHSLIAPESANKASSGWRNRSVKTERLNPNPKSQQLSLVYAEPLYGCKCTACEAAMGGDIHAALSDSLNIDLHKFPIRNDLVVQLGDHVVIKGDKTGRIRYIGHLDKMGQPNLVFAGIELDAPVGHHDGIFNKKRYFFCQKDHGLFLPLQDIRCKVQQKGDISPSLSLQDLQPSSSADALLATLGVTQTSRRGVGGRRVNGPDRLKSKSTEDFIALVGMTSRTRSPHWLQSEVLSRLDDPFPPDVRQGRSTSDNRSGEDMV